MGVNVGAQLGAAAPLVALRGVNKSFGAQQVLFDVDLDVAPGEVVVVIGPSGSGKSTLCRCINRLETIDSGEIRLAGVRLPEEGRALAAAAAADSVHGYRAARARLRLAGARVPRVRDGAAPFGADGRGRARRHSVAAARPA
jgi:ABC-type nitrate/sulfonate/bicarbonate transport system ATPase subunit